MSGKPTIFNQTQRPLVAVVILNWNGRKYLERFLPALIKSTWPKLEIVVADNCSTDDSVEFTQTNFPQISIIKNERNRGFAEGYNTALRQVNADYYILLNQDVEVTPGWIEPVMTKLMSDDAIAAAMPKLLDEKRKQQFEYAGAAGGWLDFLGYPFCRGRVFDHLETDSGQYDDCCEIFWASGAAFFVRARLFHEIGGFDPDFFAHMEEIDLSWRLRRAGYKVIYCGQSSVYHVGGGSLPRSNPHKAYLNFRNNLRLIFKNFSSAKLLWLLPFRFILDNIAILNELRQAKPADAWAIARSWGNFLISMPFWWKRRRYYAKLIEKCKRGSDRISAPGYYRRSIVWQHFIRMRNTISELPGFRK